MGFIPLCDLVWVAELAGPNYKHRQAGWQVFAASTTGYLLVGDVWGRWLWQI